jgi:hypothetical protein
MAGGEPLTSVELAQRTNTSERYVREWLINRPPLAASPTTPPSSATLPDEQAVAPSMRIALSRRRADDRAGDDQGRPRIGEIFRTGAGMGWGEHDHYMFEGCERLFRPGYLANLTQTFRR